MTALMSTLLGTAWPVNSVGVLPDVDPLRAGYVDFGEGAKARAGAAVVNAKVSDLLRVFCLLLIDLGDCRSF